MAAGLAASVGDGWMARRLDGWVVIGLVIALALAGCAPQTNSTEPALVPESAAREAVDPESAGEPQPPSRLANRPADSSTATSGTDMVDPRTILPSVVPSVTATPLPSATPAPSPSSTPPPILLRLTTGGCCTQPFWSSDSRQVLFIDRPAPDAPVGIWGVDVMQPDPHPTLVTERIAFYTRDLAFVVELKDDTTVIERTSDGSRWTVPAGGRPVDFSPGRKRIAWQESNDAPFERRMTQVWVADLDGANAMPVANLPRGSFAGWISNDVVLLSRRETLEAREQSLYTLSLIDGTVVELVRSERLRGGLLSPDRQWLAYYIALSAEPEENGLWLVRTDGTQRRRLDRELFGAYQWRDARRLLIVPFRPDAVSHELWEWDVETGESRRLTDPAITPFKIANGDWDVSPDGRSVAFVESRDRNIWILHLGD